MNLAHAQQPLRDVIYQMRHEPVTADRLGECLLDARVRLIKADIAPALRDALDKEFRRIAAHASMARQLLNDPAMPQPSQRGLESLTYATNLLDDMLVMRAIEEQS